MVYSCRKVTHTFEVNDHFKRETVVQPYRQGDILV